MFKIDLKDKFRKFQDVWVPRILCKLDDCYVQLVKIQGLGAWHHHPHTDKMLLVIEGAMVMKVKGEPDVELSAGQCMVVPKMVEHMATAKEVCHVLVFEPKAELGKGDAQRPMTVADMEWI